MLVGLTFCKFDKISSVYSVSYFNVGVRAFWRGAKPPVAKGLVEYIL